MLIGNTFESLMQKVMAMKSPELLAVLPQVEAMPMEDRSALVSRYHGILTSVIQNWDKFADVLMAQRGMSKGEVKAKAKNLKEARKNLDMAMRLANPKFIPAPFRPKAEAAFNVLTAWFIANQDYMESVYARPRLNRKDIDTLDLTTSVSTQRDPLETSTPDLVDRNDVVDGPANARSVSEDDVTDVMDDSGKSLVH